MSAIPQGIEVLVKKAAVDAEFRALLLERRAAAAELISLALEPAEALMLTAVPAAQLEAIIDRTDVPLEHRRAFLGQAAAAMLAALGAMGATAEAATKIMPAPGGIAPGPTRGIQPDPPPPPPQKTVDERVIEIVARQFNTETKKLELDTAFVKDLKATASHMVKLKAAVEKEFKIQIARDAFKKAENIRGLIDAVKEAQQPKKPVPQPPDRLPAVGGSRPDSPPPPRVPFAPT